VTALRLFEMSAFDWFLAGAVVASLLWTVFLRLGGRLGFLHSPQNFPHARKP
jgi:arginine exporter protein ArgO